MKYSVIIPAAGKGTRTNLGYNKIFYKHGGLTLLERTLAPFIADEQCQSIVVVCAPNDKDQIRQLITSAKVHFATGGASREISVFHGLAEIITKYVLVHDAARCNVTQTLINRVLQELFKGKASAVPFVTQQQALVINGRVIDDKVIQTPQGFETKLLRQSMAQATKENTLSNFVDEASIIECYGGIEVTYIPGEVENIKITTPDDLRLIRGG